MKPNINYKIKNNKTKPKGIKRIRNTSNIKKETRCNETKPKIIK